MKTIYSVGHSSHDWPTFIRLLDAVSIGVVIDVRSNPASRLPHFNRTALKERLNAVGIGYVFLGLELGGRAPEGGVLYRSSVSVTRRGDSRIGVCLILRWRAQEVRHAHSTSG